MKKDWTNCESAYRPKTIGCMCGVHGHVHIEDCEKVKRAALRREGVVDKLRNHKR